MSDAKGEVARIVKYIFESDAKLYRDQYNFTYIAFEGNGSNTCRINSTACKQWITLHEYTAYSKVPSSSTLKQVLEVLEAEAHIKGEQHTLNVRTYHSSPKSKEIWYDLLGSAVLVTETGWQVVDRPPLLFMRYAHQKPQVVPKRGGSIGLLAKYINITSKDELLLFTVFVIAAFIPDFPHPILALHGSQGAGKSTPQEALKKLIDPSAADKGLQIPKEGHFAQTANQHSFLNYDNLPTIPEWFSNDLAKASTGSSFVKRELFSNDTDIIYTFQRTIALNGISQVVTKPDLLDRLILIRLERISSTQRKTTSEYWADFEADLPYILGAIFDILSKALKLNTDVKITSLPRMADFGRWGYFIAEAAGFNGKKFIKAYSDNEAARNEAVIESNPVAEVTVEFMQDRTEWEGRPEELYSMLDTLACKLRLNKSSDWPKDAAWLSRAMRQLTSNFTAVGIELNFRHGKQRTITITKSTDASDGTDSKND
jgi:hypothetical protein